LRGGMLVVGDMLYVQGGAGDLEVLRLRDTR